METVKFQFVDNNRIQIVAERGVLMEISDAFTFYAPNFKWNPKFKNGFWDGKLRFVDYRNGTIAQGLLYDAITYCKRQNYSVELDDILSKRIKAVKEYSPEEVSSFLSTLSPSDAEGDLLTFHDFQELAVHECVKHGRRTILSATGSGKSLIIYALARYMITADEKVLIIVPSVSLVNQLQSDFKEYSQINEWDVDANTHKIFSGQEKKNSSPITISTWQSLANLPAKWFNDFTTVIGDECHQAKATEIKGVIEKAVLASNRFGFTGTLDEVVSNKMTIRGVLGPEIRVSSSKELMDASVLSELRVTPVLLEHKKTFCDSLGKLTWQAEMDALVKYEKRNRFIASLALQKLEGNTLVIVNYVDKHARPLYKLLEEINTEKNLGKKIHYITGGVDAEVREDMRQQAKTSDNNIYVATYGVFSTGVNVPRLNNCIIASPTKAKIRVLQTVGRILRKAPGKEYATLVDIGDDLSGGKKKKNVTFGHFTERLRYYAEEGFTFDLKTFKEF